MPAICQRDSREIEHGSASQYSQGKERRKSCEWVQSAQMKIFSVATKC